MRRFRDNFSFFIFRFSLLAIAAVMTGCGVSIKYSLSGASIPPDAKTFSVAYFPNNATMVSPILSSTLTEALAEIYLAQGLRDKSVAIYRKLSLRNPEKSVYFAELIGKIENNIKI